MSASVSVNIQTCTTAVPQLQTADRLTQHLLTLGGCSMLRSFLVRHFLSQISAVAEQLWQAYQVSPAPLTATSPAFQSLQIILQITASSGCVEFCIQDVKTSHCCTRCFYVLVTCSCVYECTWLHVEQIYQDVGGNGDINLWCLAASNKTPWQVLGWISFLLNYLWTHEHLFYVLSLVLPWCFFFFSNIMLHHKRLAVLSRLSRVKVTLQAAGSVWILVWILSDPSWKSPVTIIFSRS